LLRHLSFSLDYYKIDISEVISVVPGLTALSKCYNLDGSNPSYAPTNAFCALLQRDANGLLQLIRTPYLNLGRLRTSGVDLQLSWSANFADMGMGDVGTLIFSTGVGYTDEFAVQTLPNTPFQDYIGTNTIGAPHPQWKALTTLGYGIGPATISLRWRFQDAMDDVTSVTTPSAPGIGVDKYELFDLVGTFNFSDRWQVRAGITNLTDEESVFVSSSQTSTDTAVFDPVGRSYYLGLRVTM